MAWRLFVNSLDGVTINPEWSSSIGAQKIQDEHRTRTARRHQYKWVRYEKFKFDVMFVSSDDRASINGWWDASQPLFFKDEASATVYTVQITNDTRPISEFVGVTTELFNGVIELETC